MRHGKYPFIIGFLAAPVILYVVFVISPYLQAFHIAMTDWRGITASPNYAGLDNFARLLEDEVFWARGAPPHRVAGACRWSRSSSRCSSRSCSTSAAAAAGGR